MPLPSLETPAGWLLCQGQTVSRAAYARLFAAIGVQYGAGDGTTTFRLPDGRGRTLVGQDSGQTEFATPGQAAGRSFGIPATLAPLRRWYDSGLLGVVSNVGPLVRPITKADFLAATSWAKRLS